MSREPGEPIEITLKTLSPVHIASGNVIESFEFHTQDNEFYRLNIDNCFKYIFEKNKQNIDKFNKWINEVTFKQEQTAGDQKKERLKIFHFIEEYLNNRELSGELKGKISKDPTFYHYKIREYSNPENKEIKECIKTPNHLVYIPGSSIKGVIRTALMNYACRDLVAHKKTDIIKKVLSKNILNKSSKEKEEFGRE